MNKTLLEKKIAQNFSDLNIKFKDGYCYKYEINLKILGTEKFFDLLNYFKQDPDLYCQQLIDLAVVDYLYYGVEEIDHKFPEQHGFYNVKHSLVANNFKPRFGIIYQLLSLTNNLRVNLEFAVTDDNLFVPSCVELWPAANWYEREAFDLFGIIFTNHPNLNRIFNDEGFAGHPFRKDFPMSGHVDARFDAKQQQIVYDPIDLENYSAAPKVIRCDNMEELV